MIYINNEYVSFRNKDSFLNRNGLPAVINNNKKVWYKNGKLHCLDGPAFIDGDLQSWYIEGMRYDEFDYHNKLKVMGLS